MYRYVSVISFFFSFKEREIERRGRGKRERYEERGGDGDIEKGDRERELWSMMDGWPGFPDGMLALGNVRCIPSKLAYLYFILLTFFYFIFDNTRDRPEKSELPSNL
jgi:hypothetical protein